MHTTKEIIREIESIPQSEILDKIYQYIISVKISEKKPVQKEWLPTLHLGGRFDNVNIRDLAYDDDPT